MLLCSSSISEEKRGRPKRKKRNIYRKKKGKENEVERKKKRSLKSMYHAVENPPLNIKEEKKEKKKH